MAPRNRFDDREVPIDNILEGVQELNLGQSIRLPSGSQVGEAGAEQQLALLPDKPNSGRAQVVAVHIATFTPVLNSNPNGIPVGIVEFSGGGAKLGRIEFDIPASRPFPPDFRSNTTDRRGLNNGVSLAVPMGGAKILARNDAQLAFITDDTIAVAGQVDNVEASAHVARYPISALNLHRTVHVAGANANLADGTAVTFGIPNYATSVRFPRNPMSSVLEITVAGLGGSATLYTIPAGALTPTPDFIELPINPDDFTMTIRNATGGAVAVQSLRATFRLAI